MRFRLKISTVLIGFLLVLCQCETQTEVNKMDDDCKKDECCENESSVTKSETSEITCPQCGHKEVEILPTEVCVIKYNCKKCGLELTPKKGDCCVYCTYGTHKCPSMQD